ncbi:hypothetical protein PENTCL1PPCAC_19554, partial [Pristionchus entomophagus]
IMVDSFILDLSRTCKILTVHAVCEKITPEALHQLYKNMIEGSTKLRCLSIGALKDQCFSFLKLIGIIYRDDTFFSNKDIEVLLKEDNKFDIKYSIFEGKMEIILGCQVFENDYGALFIVMYDTQESVQRAKNRSVPDII